MSELTCAAESRSTARHPVWEAVLATLKEQLPPHDVQALAESVLFIETQGKSLRVVVPAKCLRSWSEAGRLSPLAAAVRKRTNGSCSLSIAAAPDDAVASGCGLDPTYALDRFVSSAANQFACAAVQLVSEFPGQRYSPLFIQGPAGSGKSHLLAGISLALSARLDLERIHCLRADALALERVAAIQKRDLPAFRARYRGCSALLIDDVDALVGREDTQEEIVHTLDALSKERIQVVAASRHTPESLPGLSAPLARRLSAGLSVRLSPPAWETRVEILMDRAQAWGAEVSSEVASFLIAASGTNFRELDALLTHALADPGCEQKLTNLDHVRQALTRAPVARQTLPPDSVIALVARHYRIRARDFRSALRSRRITRPRQIAIYLVRRNCGLSYPEIGRLFGRHHTTAIHACRATQRHLENDPTLRSELRELETALFNNLAPQPDRRRGV